MYCTVLSVLSLVQVQLSNVINAAKRKIKECREHYDYMLAEDKVLDRDFKRDFSDCEPYVDQLYKLFKRRPRLEYYFSVCELSSMVCVI